MWQKVSATRFTPDVAAVIGEALQDLALSMLPVALSRTEELRFHDGRIGLGLFPLFWQRASFGPGVLEIGFLAVGHDTDKETAHGFGHRPISFLSSEKPPLTLLCNGRCAKSLGFDAGAGAFTMRFAWPGCASCPSISRT